MSESDPLALVEAAWNIDADGPAWLNGLAEAIGRYVGAEHGVAALRVQAQQWSSGEAIAVSEVGSWALDDLSYGALGVIGARPLTTEEQAAFSHAGAVASVRRTLGRSFDAPGGFGEGFRATGVHDALFVLVGDPSGVCVSINVPLTKPLRLERRRAWSLARAASHMASSDRLRSRRAPGEPIEAGADAVLSPDGRVLDAQGDAADRGAREALREAAVRYDRSRGSLRHEAPDEALDLWTALVSGRWSLVDRFDTDGRRFIVARRNEPAAEAVLALSAREADVARLAAMGHSNKLMAYELGLSLSTVSSHLANAMAKLGVTRRVELVSLIHALRSGEVVR